MTRVTRILVLFLIPASLLAQPPGPPEQSPRPAQSVIVENEPTVNIGNWPTVDVGNIVDVDAFITNDSVPVEIVNDKVDVRVDPRTRSYVLWTAVGASGPLGTQAQSVRVPFDSHIAGVSFAARTGRLISCIGRIGYPSSDVRPGGANNNLITEAFFKAPLAGPTSFEAYDPITESKYVPIPNMFVGEGIELEIAATVSGIPSAPDVCTMSVIIYLIPATTGITPPGGGIGLPNP